MTVFSLIWFVLNIPFLSAFPIGIFIPKAFLITTVGFSGYLGLSFFILVLFIFFSKIFFNQYINLATMLLLAAFVGSIASDDVLEDYVVIATVSILIVYIISFVVIKLMRYFRVG